MSIKNHFSYQQPEKSQTEREKTINRCQYQANRDLEWSDEDFEISHHKISVIWWLQTCLKQMENMEGLKK